MSRISGWAGALFCVASLAAGAETVPIRRVVVFCGQAQVERSGPVSLKEGANTLTLSGLPSGLQRQSVRVRAGAGGVTVERIEVEPVHERLVREKEAAELKEQVEALNQRIHALRARASRAAERLAFLEAIQVRRPPHDPDKAPPPVALSPEAWMQVLDFVEKGMAAHAKESQALAREIADANEQVEVLSTKLERLAGKDVKHYANVHVYLRAEKTLSCPVRVTYRVHGPEWYPRYELRADVEKSTVALSAYALVRQRTGEDWSEADLVFSTANLAASAELPKLATTRISPEGMLMARSGRPAGEKRGSSVLQWSISARKSKRPAPATPQPEVEQREVRSLTELRNSLQGQRQQIDAISGLENAPVSGRREEEKRDSSERRARRNEAVARKPWAAPVQQEVQTRRYGQMRGLYRQQKQAKARGDFDSYAAMNRQIVNLHKTLDTKSRQALAGLNKEALSNIEFAQRQLRSQALAEGLCNPLAAAAGVDHRFEALGPANVASDWTFSRVPVLETAVPVEMVYECAPALKELCFLVATGVNPLQKPLLSGPSAVFVGPDFIGTGLLPTTPSGKELRFELGVDREVEVKRRVERKRDTRGLIWSEYRYDYGVTVEIVNRRRRAIRILLVDRVPWVREDASVTVYDVTATPDPTEWHERQIGPDKRVRDGLMKWRFGLDPGAKREVTFGYKMRYSTSLRLVGHEEGGAQ